MKKPRPPVAAARRPGMVMAPTGSARRDTLAGVWGCQAGGAYRSQPRDTRVTPRRDTGPDTPVTPGPDTCVTPLGARPHDAPAPPASAVTGPGARPLPRARHRHP